VLNQPESPTYYPPESHIEGKGKLARLIADDFPFDESQLQAIDGIAKQQYACLTGAAGTGKTTCTKAIVDRIQDGLGSVDMTTYFKAWTEADKTGQQPEDSEDEPDMSKKVVPSICLVGFTGRSSQMIKKNFPRDWHPNIMTIHRMLAFKPEFYEDYDAEFGGLRKKMRFIPTYNASFKLPWDVIVIDEAGMTSVDLWEQVWAACTENTRVIMIGDINQLPPVHGRSIFGFAMTSWPSWELTHIHRQEGKNNSIVDNAWAILKGIKPRSDDFKADPSWKFAMMPLPEDSIKASSLVRAWLARMNGKAYQPNRDSVITAINGDKGTERGFPLGQVPMNRELAIVFNKDAPRYVIDAGRERKQFAVGDKVMATRNDHEVGITNGMTGIITSIERNGEYSGDYMRFGRVDEVSRYLNELDEPDEDDFSLEELSESMEAVSEGLRNSKEAKDRGPASHVVTVRFGEGEHEFTIPFGSLAEVASLMTAYVVTCHKMQGGESPLVVIICHQAHKSMLDREWLYTAVTRASQKCVLFYTDLGLRTALSKQRITGSTLQQKVKVFQDLQTGSVVGKIIDVRLPQAMSLSREVGMAAPTMLEQVSKPTQISEPNRVNPLEKLVLRARERSGRASAESGKPQTHETTHVHIHVHAYEKAHIAPTNDRVVVDGGTLRAQERQKRMAALTGKYAGIMDKVSGSTCRDVIAVSQPITLSQAKRPSKPQPLLLTHQPAPQPKVATGGKFRFGAK
jgi:hypothetical protein